MRRTTPGSVAIAAEQARLIAALDSLDVGGIVRVLGEFATPERVARLERGFAARIGAVTVLMDAPHDPHNGAAVVRSCDAFGVHRLHVVERVETFLAARSIARGSEQWVEVRTHAAAASAVATLQASGHELVATHPRGELVPADLRGIPRLAVVLGNERQGILNDLGAACVRSVRIPMRGFAESLNLSVTAAILLERATEGRTGDLTEDEQRFLLARALVLTVPHASEILQARGVRVHP